MIGTHLDKKFSIGNPGRERTARGPELLGLMTGRQNETSVDTKKIKHMKTVVRCIFTWFDGAWEES